jgi:hypothetical protein
MDLDRTSLFINSAAVPSTNGVEWKAEKKGNERKEKKKKEKT